MESDTLDDLPDLALSAVILNDTLFAQLHKRVGVIFTGLASQQFDSTAFWGRSLQLSDDETLQLRVLPRGLFSAPGLVDLTNRVVMISSRRRGPYGKDFVSLAILWDGEKASDLKVSAFDILAANSQSVACRNLHIVCPSIFSEHDAEFKAAPEGQKPSPLWPVLDEFSFHSIRPVSFTVSKPIMIAGSTDALVSMHAAPGTSQFVIAGHFANTSMEDVVYASAERTTAHQWQKLCRVNAASLQKKVGLETAEKAMHTAATVTEMLSIEGLLSILSHNFACGALPDMMHSPGGFPLLIAFAVRLACYPERFACRCGTASDLYANSDLRSIFESEWEPITPEKAGGHYLYAIDVMIRGAYKEAMQSAEKTGTRQAVQDNVTFWQRAGQRCISSVFGPQLHDFLPFDTPLGSSEHVQDPITEARNKVIQKKMSASDVSATIDAGLSIDIATVSQKRHALLMVLNSVEHWARTGEYCEIQIHPRNDVTMTVSRSEGSGATTTKQELRRLLENGMEESIREMVLNGDAKDEEDARQRAQEIREGVENALASHADDTPFDLTRQKLPVHVAVDDGETKLSDLDTSLLDPNTVCFGAFQHGMSAISTAMCQGTLIHHQFGMSCFLASPHATNTCADCDATVHLLTSTFLGTRFGSCPTCQRPRCLACMSKVQRATPRNKHDAAKSCLRCKAAKEGKYKPVAKDTSRKKTPKSQRAGKAGMRAEMRADMSADSTTKAKKATPTGGS